MFFRIHHRCYIGVTASFGCIKSAFNMRPASHRTFAEETEKEKVVFVPIKSPHSSHNTFDIFINDLMNSKEEKWKIKLSKFKLSAPPSSAPADLVTQASISEPQSEVQDDDVIKNILQAAEVNDHEFVSKLLTCPVPLNLAELRYLATNFERFGYHKGIELLEEIATKTYKKNVPHFYENRLTCLNQKGENCKSLAYCEELYRSYPELRRVVRGHLSIVLACVVSQHSEAGLVRATQLTESLSVVYRDFRPMAALWNACFLSEWFSDQQVASQLFELLVKNEALHALERRMMAATFTALGQHRTQLVHNLLEELLKLNLQKHFATVLSALFDYKCAARDLKGCAAILRTSVDHNVFLSSHQHSKFLKLLCDKRWMSKSKFSQSTDQHINPKPPPPFQMDF